MFDRDLLDRKCPFSEKFHLPKLSKSKAVSGNKSDGLLLEIISIQVSSTSIATIYLFFGAKSVSAPIPCSGSSRLYTPRSSLEAKKVPTSIPYTGISRPYTPPLTLKDTRVSRIDLVADHAPHHYLMLHLQEQLQ